MPESTVAVIVATRGRPDGCVRTVGAVLAQQIPPGLALRVVVVDNNDRPEHLDLPMDVGRVRTVHEPVTGIPDARNRGIAEVLPQADFVVFVDDDEVPASDRWLAELLAPLRSGDAEVTAGPVRPVFPAGTPEWLRRQPIFNRPVYRDGAPLREAHTNNVAALGSVYASRDVWFDVSFRKTGGSDTEFFRRVGREGGRIRWVSAAVVNELVPAARAKVRWVLARSRRIGANRVQFLRAEQAGPPRWVVYFLGSVGEGLLLVPAALSCVFSRRLSVRLVARSLRGCGFLLALAGRGTRSYR